MLRLVLLAIYLAASYSAGQPAPKADVSAGLDPNGLTVEIEPPTTDVKAGLDPDGITAQTPATADVRAGLDPNG